MWNLCNMWLIYALSVMCAILIGCGAASVLHESEAVGFTAYAEELHYYHTSDVIRFSGELVNAGGHYKATEGRFYCPYNGVYFLSVNLMRCSTHDMDLAVIVDGRFIVHAFDPEDENEFNVASNSAVFDCAAGEHVSLIGTKNPDYGSGCIYGEPGIKYSTFTIFMMSKDAEKVSLHESFTGFSSVADFQYLEYYSGHVIPWNRHNKRSPDYNRNTGIYTCPVSGVYYITMNMQKFGGDGIHMSVSQDGQAVLHTDDGISSGNSRTTVSNSRLLVCEENQTLAVNSTGYGWITAGYLLRPSTSFSVMLMYQQHDPLHTSFSGFTAAKTSDQNYTLGETIIFDTVLLDIGGDFNQEQNSFICPVNGLYFAAITLKKVGITPLMVDLVMETGSILRSMDSSYSNPNNAISNSGLFVCSPGQPVKVISYGDGAVHGHLDKIYTSFSVMLIQQFQ